MSRYWPAAVALAAGLLLGYLTGGTLARGGYAALGALVYMLIAVAIVAALGVIALVAGLTDRGSLARVSFVSGVVLAVTTAVTAVGLVNLNPASRHQVVLYATGTASAVLDAGGFEPAGHATVRCVSHADSTTASQIESADLGELKGAKLHGFVRIPEAGVGEAAVFLFVGSAGSGGEMTLRWSGNAGLDATEGGLSGTASFTGLPLDQLTPDPPQTEGWPSVLSGELEWRCDPWLSAGSYLE